MEYGRELTTRRMFRRKYRVDYDKVIAFNTFGTSLGAGISASRHFKIIERPIFHFAFDLRTLNLSPA